jgi:hypothetical protein
MGLRKIKRLSMYKALKLGYLRNERKQAKRLKRFGYVVDKELTNNQHLVARNAFNGKVLFVNNGSSISAFDPNQTIKDWRSNVLNVPTGTFQYTPRYQEDKNTYLKAKAKYKDAPFVMVAHSQGSISLNDLAKKGDKAYTYNGAFLKQKDNPNVTNYRSKGDVVSMFANPNDMKTLASPVTQNPIAAHNIENIKQLPVFV